MADRRRPATARATRTTDRRPSSPPYARRARPRARARRASAPRRPRPPRRPSAPPRRAPANRAAGERPLRREPSPPTRAARRPALARNPARRSAPAYLRSRLAVRSINTRVTRPANGEKTRTVTSSSHVRRPLSEIADAESATAAAVVSAERCGLFAANSSCAPATRASGPPFSPADARPQLMPGIVVAAAARENPWSPTCGAFFRRIAPNAPASSQSSQAKDRQAARS